MKNAKEKLNLQKPIRNTTKIRKNCVGGNKFCPRKEWSDHVLSGLGGS